MPEINKTTCAEIIQKRKDERLPKIERKLEEINKIKDKLIGLKEFRDRIQRNDAALARLADRAPGVVDTISRLNLVPLLGSSENAQDSGAIFELETELNRLKRRFNRDRIQIALIGKARKGKSTFLQSVSGLNDDVIPTSSFTDCTGAVSVIEHHDGEFKMEIEFYSEKEFVGHMNSALEKFGYSDLQIRNKDEIIGLSDNRRLIEDCRQDVKNFYTEYLTNPEPYLQLIGNGNRTFDAENDVIEYVAKYKIIPQGVEIPLGYAPFLQKREETHTIVYFNKYIAVKKTRIWSQYPFDGADNIVMLDTVGLGNENTKDKDKAAMYKVLREDVDAAIYNFAVPTSGMSSAPADEIEEIDGVFKELSAFEPEKWIIININTRTAENFEGDFDWGIYDGLCNKILEEIGSKRFGEEGNKQPALFTVRVSNKNREEVIGNVMNPLLENIRGNLSALDDAFMNRSEEMATNIYNLYAEIVSRLTRAFDNIVAQSPTFLATFNENYNRLSLRLRLDEYVAELSRSKDEVCEAIVNELGSQLTDLTSLVPSREEIEIKLRGMDAHHIQNVYFGISDHVTARIISRLNDVSAKAISDVQDSVKIRIARLLHDDGKLNLLNLKTGSLTDDSKAIEWLTSLCRERLSDYPELEKAVNAVVNFRMNIEGYIYAECIKACEVLQDNNIQFPADNDPIETKTYFIWNTILQKVGALCDNLRVRFGIRKNIGFGNPAVSELAKPSLLIWCLADSFCKQFLRINNGEDLRNFYCEYAPVIWRDEIQLQEDIKEATESVKELIKSLKEHNDINLYK